MHQLLSDIRFAIRQIARNQGFAIAAVATLTVGIGANTAVFSLLNGVWLRPLSYPGQERLVYLNTTAPNRGRAIVGVSLPDFVDWRARSGVFEGMAAFRMARAVLSGQGEARRIAATRVSYDTFAVLGVTPVLGRSFRADEGRAGGEPVAIIGHSLWQDFFGQDPAVVGRQLVYDGRPHTIVGVMPPGFGFPDQAVAWLPLPTDVPASERSNHMYEVVARLKPGVSVGQARLRMAEVARQLARDYPDSNGDVAATLGSLRTYLVGAEPGGFVLLMGAVGFVLLVACANLAGLLLARVASRRREIAIRLALGACRWRIVRLLMVESALLAAAGGTFGLLAGAWARDMFVSVQPFGLPTWLRFDTDMRVVGFVIAVTAFTAAAFGVVPAIRASRSAPGPSLGHGRAATDAASLSRLRGALVVAQVGLAVVLLSGAGLLIRSLLQTMSVDPGFRTDHVLTLRIDLPTETYAADDQVRRFFDEAVQRTRALPGVQRAAAVSYLPLAGRDWGQSYWVEGAPATPRGEEPIANNRTITPDYFDVMGIPLVRGRRFDERDGAAGTSAVVIVNQALAERHWPGQDPVGKRIRLGPPGDPLLTVVGVAGNVRHDSLTMPVREGIYLPHQQLPMRRMALVLRTSTAPETLAGSIRQQVAAMDRGLPVFDVRTMEEVVDRSLSIYRISSWMVGGFAVAAMLLAALGVGGLVSYAVTRRTREIAIRMALGANAVHVAARVMRQGLVQIAIGTALGLAGGAALTVSLRTMLHGLRAVEPGVLASVAAILVAVAVVACYVPVRRATHVDPIEVLRDE